MHAHGLLLHKVEVCAVPSYHNTSLSGARGVIFGGF